MIMSYFDHVIPPELKRFYCDIGVISQCSYFQPALSILTIVSVAMVLTCISCRVMFSNSTIQRHHYDTDWHVYNLKRKVVGFPPVTAEEFQHRVLQQREKKLKENEVTSTYCRACRKTFSSKKTYDNHKESKKHKDAVSLLASTGEEINEEDVATPMKEKVKKPQDEIEEVEDVEDSDVDSDEWDDEDEIVINEDNPILNNNCLFCSHHSSSMTKNVNHMSIEHSFFIPDVEYVTDLRELLLYLGEKVVTFNVCLWCKGSRSFNSLEATQAHMRDKGHCKMLYEDDSLAEYSDYYNYSSSYPDDMDVDEVVVPDFESNDFELKLPSGGVIGHRALLTYYRQHYSGNQTVATKKDKLSKVLSTYRALGWKETDKNIVTRRVKDIRFMKVAQAKMAMRLGVKANKLQRHFRPQVNF